MRLPRFARLAIFAVVVLLIIGGIAFGLYALLGGSRQIGATDRIQAELTETVVPFADGYLVSNGMAFRFYGPGNKAEAAWSYTGKDFSVSDKLLAVWQDSSLAVLNAKGEVSFNGSLEGPIEFARCGKEAVAAYLPGSGSMRVLSREGGELDTIQTGAMSVLDAGFYSDQDLLWILLLNTSSTQPTTLLRTYQPGKAELGGQSFDDQLIYSIVYNDNKLYAVGTGNVSIVSLASNELLDKKPMTFGWQLIDKEIISGNDVGLLFTLSGESASASPERLMLVRGDGSERQLHLPPGCIAAFVGAKGVWGVAPQKVYFLPFTGNMSEYELDFTISGIGSKLPGGKVILRADNETKILTLP